MALALGGRVAVAADAGAPAASISAAAERSSADTADKAKELLASLAAATSATERLELAAELAALRPTPVSFFAEFLARERSSSDADRRAVLGAIGAQVPDEHGRFNTPGRTTKKEEQAADDFDWLAELVKLERQPGLGEVIADVAAIRALAASTNPDAGTVILDHAFSEPGLVYRDECGRYLRRMSPYSLPALIYGSENRRNRSIKRYATYQLERLDRENPDKAFADAPTDALKVDILEAYAGAQQREAVYTVLEHVDHISPRVRAAARAAWLEYTTGKPPPEPPKRKLELPGGKLSDEEEPLWLDHRQLADIALRRKLEELTGEAPPKKASLEEMNQQLFDHYDQARKKRLDEAFAAAQAQVDAGKLDDAIAGFDRILAQLPEYDRRAEMAPGYFAYAEAKAEAGEWREAAIGYGKAHSVAPDGELAEKAMSQHHFARGKAVEASGGDGAAEFARAEELGAPAVAADDEQWLLIGGIAAVGAAVVLLLVAMLRRRSAAA